MAEAAGAQTGQVMRAQGSPGHRLRVRRVVTETAQARSLVFEVPEELRERFAYLPGQFLTLRVPVPGGALGRCYSLSSTPGVEHDLKVTVKRVAGGTGSNWICDHVEAGDLIEVLPPAGRFTSPDLMADHLLIAAGSGITPIMSILKAVLSGPAGRAVLLYANRDETSVIFAGELRELAARHPERLTVIHLLESVQGRPTADQLAPLVRPFAGFAGAFVCGPEPFMDAAERALLACGMPRGRVTTERFHSLAADPFRIAPEPADTQGGQGSRDAQDAAPVRLAVTLDGRRASLSWPSGTTLLEVLLAGGLDAPFSCREGSCSACACKVVSGEVKMLRNEVLEEQDLAEGWVLGCQSLPVTEAVEVTYDD
ncbi:ferredoxin--NADP reductase [Planomonospora alba]|uniref:Ferredoxin--NADP reductase n=1 Tax=Planomonospora alba TaxID=161354 RepID=A0ABP6NFZ8_9ACTN